MTTKTCISCASNFIDESLGDNGLGVCPECNDRLETAMKQNLEMFEVPHGNPKVFTVRESTTQAHTRMGRMV